MVQIKGFVSQINFLNFSPIPCLRLAFIEDYTLKSLRLKPEKWNKLVISDDQRGFLHSFVDQGRNNRALLI